MNDLKTKIEEGLKFISSSWTSYKKKLGKSPITEFNVSTYSKSSIRDVAFEVMEYAYQKASNNGRYYANARQIMYAARPEILKRTSIRVLKSSYFTQTILKDYIELKEPDWKIVWDARGNFNEPHTGRRIPLGGRSVIDYYKSWLPDLTFTDPTISKLIKTSGPKNRFSNILFIEKEGFMEILEHAKIQEEYDMALMSTKGIPTKAACDLIKYFSDLGVRIFALHDFDYSGFKIMKTFKEGARLSEGSVVIDLGLRIDDIRELPSERVVYKQIKNPSEYLYECGATSEEIDFLVEPSRSKTGWKGQRVEINAMTSNELITWLKNKLNENDVSKYLPSKKVVEQAYKNAVKQQYLDESIKSLSIEFENNNKIKIPNNLYSIFKSSMKQNKSMQWDELVWKLACKGE